MTVTREIATPDFYTYPWQPLATATLGSTLDSVTGWVTVTWPDGLSLPCYALWLAENTAGLGLDPVTRESMIDPGDLPAPEALLAATVTNDGALELQWHIEAEGMSPTPLITHVHPGWLRHVAEGRATPEATLPSMQAWTGADFSEPPTVDATHIETDPDVLLEWLALLRRFGLARLENTPTTQDSLAAIVGKLGSIRGSNFGDVFEVRSIPNPRPEENSTANTGLNLGQHADLPTREIPPGFQFLQCIENEVDDGWSRMTDGLAVAAEIERSNPEHYEALTTLRWTFVNRSPEADHRWTGPMIDLGAPGQPLTMRAFYPVRAFPAMDPADVPLGYAAMRTFSQVAHSEHLQLRYPWRPGDLVGFDNRRVLHGRDAFDPSKGSRYLRGCYLDQDDVWSRLRVLSRAAESASRGATDSARANAAGASTDRSAASTSTDLFADSGTGSVAESLTDSFTHSSPPAQEHS